MAQVQEYKSQFETGTAAVSMDLMNFLNNWLVNHIQGIDRQYVSILKANNTK